MQSKNNRLDDQNVKLSLRSLIIGAMLLGACASNRLNEIISLILHLTAQGQ